MRDSENFERLLIAAKTGGQEATARLLAVVSPIIKKYSRRGGRLDEDLCQYISMRIIQALRSFTWDK